MPLVRWIIRCMKRRPGAITLQAKLRVPIGDWSSCRVVDSQDWKLERADLIHSTLSSGSLASIFPESSTIPMNWITWEGPSVLDAEIGLFRVLKIRIILDRLARQSESSGGLGQDGSTMRKSSKMWQTKEMQHLLSKTHSMEWDNWLKMHRAERSPNGSILSK